MCLILAHISTNVETEKCVLRRACPNKPIEWNDILESACAKGPAFWMEPESGTGIFDFIAVTYGSYSFGLFE